MENPARYSQHIYHSEKDAVYVNLFIASRAEITDRELVIRQETDFPATDRTKLIMEQVPNTSFKLRIRIPYWVAGSVTAIVDGQTFANCSDGYLEIDRIWNAGDIVDVTLPMKLHKYQKKDDDTMVGFMYGPIVLAGALGRERFPENDIVDNHLKLHPHPIIEVPTLVTDDSDIEQWIHPVKGKPLTFVTDAVGEPGNTKVTLIPFYSLHHERYTIYWKLMNKREYENYADLEREARERLKAITVDVVEPHAQQSEVEHGLQTHNSKSDYSNWAQQSYREAVGEGYFSYRMAVHPNHPMLLQVTYFGNDKATSIDGLLYEREFDIRIDGDAIARQKLNGENPDELFDVQYAIPTELTSNKDHVEVKFASDAGRIAGAVYGIRMIDGSM